MEAAERLFADHGFAGASVRDIAREAGVNIAMISYYFGSKEALLKAIVYNRMESAALMIRSVIDDPQKSPVEKLDLLMDNYVERILNAPTFNRMLIREQLSQGMDWFRTVVREVKQNNNILFRQLLEQGSRDGVFKNVEVPLMLATVIGTLHQILASPQSLRDYLQASELSEAAYQEKLIRLVKKHIRSLVHNMILQPSES